MFEIDKSWHDNGVGSTYTIRLQVAISSGFDIGLDKYPIFDENYRQILNNKILGQFYYKEIGYETLHLFKQKFNLSMDVIMPYYNEKYKANLIEYDPLTNYKYREKYDRTRDDIAESTAKNNTKRTEDLTGNSNSDTTNSTLTIENDTPQSNITRQNLNNGVYADKVTQYDGTENNQQSQTQNQNVNEDNTGEANSKLNTTEDYIRDIYGYRGITPTAIFNEVYDAIRNTDMEILHDRELLQHFMGIY